MVTGRDWSTAFRTTSVESEPRFLSMDAEDPNAGLRLRTEIEALPGGAARSPRPHQRRRCRLRRRGPRGHLPAPRRQHRGAGLQRPARAGAGAQRRPLTDGSGYVSRGAAARHDAASVVLAGTPGFTFSTGRVVGVSLAWSGNSVLRVERDGASAATIGVESCCCPARSRWPPVSLTSVRGFRGRRNRRPGRSRGRAARVRTVAPRIRQNSR